MDKLDKTVFRWGVMGCGNIAHVFARSMKTSDRGQLLACAASDLSRAHSFADQYNIPNVQSDYINLATYADIDAIYIATTHNFHFEQILLCLRHNKHVLCEKPLTINAKQAKVVQQVAKERNLLVLEAVWTRFLPAIQALQGILNQNLIGKVSSMYANFSIQPEISSNHRLMNKNLAGGALLDLGIYTITLADLVFNEVPKSIAATAKISTTEVDETSHYMLTYSNDATAILSASFVQSAPIQCMIFGDKGHIKLPHFMGAKGFEVTINDDPAVSYTYDYDDDTPFIFEIEHFHNCLLSSVSSSLIHPLQKSISILEIMDAIRSQIGLRYNDVSENAATN